MSSRSSSRKRTPAAVHNVAPAQSAKKERGQKRGRSASSSSKKASSAKRSPSRSPAKRSKTSASGKKSSSSSKKKSTSASKKKSGGSTKKSSPATKRSPASKKKSSSSSSSKKKSPSSSSSSKKKSSSSSSKRSQAAKKAATTRGRGIGSRVQNKNPAISKIPFKADASEGEHHTAQHNPKTEAKRMSHYSDKRKRQAEHIEESYEKKGMGSKKAKAIAFATVNKQRADHGEAENA